MLISFQMSVVKEYKGKRDGFEKFFFGLRNTQIPHHGGIKLTRELFRIHPGPGRTK